MSFQRRQWLAWGGLSPALQGVCFKAMRPSKTLILMTVSLLLWGCATTAPNGDLEPFVSVSTPQIKRQGHPLHTAAAQCDVEGVKEAIDRGDDVDARDRAGRTPLAIACQGNCFEAAVVLIAAGGDVHGADAHGMTPLMQAAGAGSVSCVELLLRHEPDLLATTHEGLDGTHLAASTGQAECVRRLLASGADADRFTISGRTPLMQAAEAGQVACVVVLLDHGADVSFEDAAGHTARGLAASGAQATADPGKRDRYERIIELLLVDAP